VRNIGSSIGISLVIAQLTNTTVKMHAHLTEYVSPFHDPLKMPDVAAILNTATDQGRALLNNLINQQAAIIAYGNDFKLLMLLTLAAIPLVFLIRAPKSAAPAGDHDAVLD
jgi:DHA2 family multidrug resistance protein